MIGLEDQRVQLTDIARFESGVDSSQGLSQPRSLPEVPRNTFASVMIVAAAGREHINNETDDLS